MTPLLGRLPTRAMALALLWLSLVACGGSAHSAADLDDQPPPPEQSAREALDELETTPEQEDQLLALVGKFAIVLSKSGKARRAFTDELLASLLSGRVDHERMKPLRTDFEKAIRDAMPKVLALINELHAILTPEQRAKLSDALAARAEASEEKRKARNQSIIDALDIGLMQKVAIGSALQEKMGARRAAFEQVREDGRAAGEAFKRADFDATKLALAKRDLGHLYLETFVILIDTLAPELEHEQRVTLSHIIKYRLNGEGRRR